MSASYLDRNTKYYVHEDRGEAYVAVYKYDSTWDSWDHAYSTTRSLVDEQLAVLKAAGL